MRGSEARASLRLPWSREDRSGGLERRPVLASSGLARATPFRWLTRQAKTVETW